MTLSAVQWDFASQKAEDNYRRALRRYPAQVVVDLATLRDNMKAMVDRVHAVSPSTAVLGVVKADAYVHGLLPTALAALAGGATWLGTAQSREALRLRQKRVGPDRARIITWL